jgi:PAS domain S-box-containing protein
MKNTHNNSSVTKKTARPESIEHEAEAYSAIADVDLLQDLLEYAADHINFKDINSRFFIISKSQAVAFGLSDPSEAIGKSDFDFFTKEHAEQAYRDEQEVMQTGTTLIREEKETWADRPDNWVETIKTPLYDKRGVIIGTFGISKDITELVEERNLIRALMDNLPDAIYFKNRPLA